MQISEEIIKEYKEYYKQLLATRKPENTVETIAEERVKKEFESIMKHKNDGTRENILFTLVKKAISTMKKKESSR